MNLKELLKSLGVADDVIAKIIEEMPKNKLYISSEENIDLRYTKLKEQNETLKQQYAEAQTTIDGFNSSEKNNTELQEKITQYEATINELKTKNEKSVLDGAIKIALLEAKAKDTDYMSFKLREKGTQLTVDENGKLKDSDKIITELKTAHPDQFESNDKPPKNVKEKPLTGGEGKKEGDGAITKEQFNKMGYLQRVKLYKENPELYKSLMGMGETKKETTEE